MDLLILVVVLVAIGFGVYALTTYVPLPPGWAKVIQVIAVIVLLLYALSRFARLPNVLPH